MQDDLRRQLKKASARLTLQSFLQAFRWTLLASFVVSFLFMVIPKIVYLPYTFSSWGRLWFVLSAVSSVVLAAIYAWSRRPSPLAAAVEIDRRYQLRERCSSALLLRRNSDGSPMELAVEKDAALALQRIDLRDKFPIRPVPQTTWVVLPMAACAALFWVPDAKMTVKALARNASGSNLRQVKNSTEPLIQSIEKKVVEAEQAGDLQTVEDLKKLQAKIQELQRSENTDKKEVISDLNSIKQELQKKRDALTSAEDLKQSLERLKNLEKGPADELSKALQMGDLETAGDQLQKMIDDLRSGELSAEQLEQLQKQLDRLQQTMDDAASERDQQLNEAQRELEKAKKDGDTARVGAISKQLERLRQSEQRSKSLDSVKSRLSKAQQSLQEGDPDEASDALSELDKDLSDLEEDESEADRLQELMDSLEDAKQATKCEKCAGKGCEECKSNGAGKPRKAKKNKSDQSGKSSGSSKSGKPNSSDDSDVESSTSAGGKKKVDSDAQTSTTPGNGQGKGIGSQKGDDRLKGQDDDGEFSKYDGRVRESMQQGETVEGGPVAGSNRKGATREQVRDAVRQSEVEDPDSMENIQLPKSQRDQLREYFDKLRERK